MLSRGNLELVLSTPFDRGGAANPMPDGGHAEPGGWKPHHNQSRGPLCGSCSTSQCTTAFPHWHR